MKQFVIVWFCVFATVIAQEPSSECKTPNGETASCISLFKCPILVNAGANDDPIVTKFIQESACGDGNFMVCCGSSETYTKKQIKPQLPNKTAEKTDMSTEESRKFALEKLLPSRFYCGLQHTDDYLYTKEETSVDEFPWMVYIPTKTSVQDFVFRVEENCAGALISNRYVLTHKDCNSTYVHLGQHHIYPDLPSCTDTPDDIDDCTKPPLNAFIDDYINSETHNFTLLRLETKVSFTDFVRPICLPLEGDKGLEAGDVVFFSGWDEQRNIQGKNVMLKKRIKHKLAAKDKCQSENPVANLTCADWFGNNTAYVCAGDKGGPLMYRHNSGNLNWVTLGLVQETSSCAEHKPAPIERITTDVVNWILDNLKP